MLCSACQATIPESVKFCPKCGARAEVPAAEIGSKRCPQCGTDNPLNAKFCKKDGYRLDSLANISDTTVETAVSEVVALDSSELMASELVSKKLPPAADSVICPQCGTKNSANAKFCKKDRYSLQASVTATAVTQAIPTKQSASVRSAEIGSEVLAANISAAMTAGKSRKGLVIGALTGFVLLACAGGYSYWAGYIGNRQGDIQEKINTELASRGWGNVKAIVDREWSTSLSGSVPNQADKEQALALVRIHKELKLISADQVQVKPDAAILEESINKALANAGFRALTAKVDDELVATLSGGVQNEKEKLKAIAIAKSVVGVKDAQLQLTEMDEAPVSPTDSIPEATPLSQAEVLPAASVQQPAQAEVPSGAVNRATLERDLNSKLHTAGMGGLIGHVNSDMSIVLSGTVNTAAERDEALHLATSMPGSKGGVRANIHIAAPAAPQIPTPEKTAKAKKVQKQPELTQPAIQPEQPNNNPAVNSKNTEPAPTPRPEVPKSINDLLENLKHLKTRPATQEDQQNKSCPMPGQSC